MIDGLAKQSTTSVPVGVAFASQIQDDDGLVMRRVHQSHFKIQRWTELIKSHINMFIMWSA